jgi:hypothetical protein
MMVVFSVGYYYICYKSLKRFKQRMILFERNNFRGENLFKRFYMAPFDIIRITCKTIKVLKMTDVEYMVYQLSRNEPELAKLVQKKLNEQKNAL